MDGNTVDLGDDLKFVAEGVKEIQRNFDQQTPNFPPITQRPASVIDIVSDSDDSDDEISQRIRALEQIQQKDEITGPIRTVHEKTLDQAEVGEIPKFIPPDSAMVPIAVVQYFSGNFSIARSIDGKGVTPGSLLADANRNPITRVLELFGPISNPQIILKGQIPIGTELFAVVSESEFPDPDQIAKQFRGCDASNRFDEEAPFQDFSDDEEEREYKHRMKASKKAKSNKVDQDINIGYPRFHPSNE